MRCWGAGRGCHWCVSGCTPGGPIKFGCSLPPRGFPLVGDRKYGGGEEGESIALWSWRLEFTHPQTGAAMRFSHLPPKEAPWLGFPMPLTGR